MRLKKIEIVGFKSFADRQLVVVDEHVTAVIGPNGCGKSNIVDAVRWCMGEQSAKHLRGAGMADVIFAGCASRGPAGMAEATITFEMHGDAPAAHLDHPEIAITRRLYADGTSEYLINKVPSRLRDITDLLMGTGAGTKGYSIIEQGQVGRIVSSKPEERRHIIDEAAGITRFKAQKAAAERKIEATRNNLLRVHDVIGELEARLGTLRRQAQKAERYKRYKLELRDLDLWAASHKFLELQCTGEVLRRRGDDLGQQVDDLRTALQTREAQIEARRAGLSDVEQELSEHQQIVYDLDNRVQLLEAEDDYRRREREDLQTRAAQSKAEAEVATRALAHIEEELAEVNSEQAAHTGEDEEPGEVAVGRLEGLYTRIDAELADERRRLDEARAKLREHGSAVAGAEARAVGQDETLTERRARAETLAAQREELETQARNLAATFHQAAGEATAAQERVEGLERRRIELTDQRASLRERVAAAEVEHDTKRAEVHRCRSRLQSLEEIQARYRGCHSGVQLVMEHADELGQSGQLDTHGGRSSIAEPSVLGILADYVEAPQHLEHAVSAVLGDRLESVVVDVPEVAARGIELLKRKQEGRTSFVPVAGYYKGRDAAADPAEVSAADPAGLGGIEVVDLSDTPARDDAVLQEDGVLGRLSDLIELRGDLARSRSTLLGDTIVVDGLRRALELRQSHRGAAGFVTLDGDRLERDGVIVGGSPNALNAALLQQKREIRELSEILIEIEETLRDANARHLALAEQLRRVDTEREDGERELIDAESERVESRGRREQLELDRTRVSSAREELDAEAERVDLEIESRRQEADVLGSEVEQLRTSIAALERGITASQSRVVTLVGDLEEVASQLTEAKVEFARWQQRHEALSASADRLQRQADGERERIDRLFESAKESEARCLELDAETQKARSQREELASQSRDASGKVSECRERFDALKLELDELEASLRTLRGDLDERRERLNEAQMGLREIELEREHLRGDMRERFDAEITTVLVDFHDRPRQSVKESSRHKDLKRILSRMGEVNLTAIDEYEEVSERYEYLSTQRSDLENAIGQLQEAIDKINKTTRERFKQTFAAVNERFQMLFPRLFNGGRAELKMTDPHDLLGTGVEIAAQPPGKQLRSLDLLSGGEKALTAVSLIFAIFLIKPSPFCLLDEVDAPLDDANVARFCQLVHELAGETQFVIITHNKVTMEMADRLYGVTMEQRGVSKLVSVNLRRAVELAYN